MRFAVGTLVVLMNLADNATTFLCLRAPVPDFELVEANPAGSWLFDTVGLLPGLIFEMSGPRSRSPSWWRRTGSPLA
jgi:hypothetical protein